MPRRLGARSSNRTHGTLRGCALEGSEPALQPLEVACPESHLAEPCGDPLQASHWLGCPPHRVSCGDPFRLPASEAHPSRSLDAAACPSPHAKTLTRSPLPVCSWLACRWVRPPCPALRGCSLAWAASYLRPAAAAGRARGSSASPASRRPPCGPAGSCQPGPGPGPGPARAGPGGAAQRWGGPRAQGAAGMGCRGGSRV